MKRLYTRLFRFTFYLIAGRTIRSLASKGTSTAVQFGFTVQPKVWFREMEIAG